MERIGLNTCLIIILGGIILLELVSLTGLISAPHEHLYRTLLSEQNIFSLGFVLANTFLMKIFCDVTKKEMFIILSFGLLFTILYTANPNISEIKAMTISSSFWRPLTIPLAGLGIASLSIIIYRSFFLLDEQTNKNKELFFGSVCLFLMSLIMQPALQLTTVLHPNTFDLSAYKFDLSLGFSFSSQLAFLLEEFPLLMVLSRYSYAILPITMSILYGLYVANPNKAPSNTLTPVFISIFCGFIIYHLVPVTGPNYVFFGNFPTNMLSLEDLEMAGMPGFSIVATDISRTTPEGENIPIHLIARNAFPSLHFSWALIAWLISLRFAFWVKALFGSLLIFNILATLGHGEHYLIDLIAAAPFVLFVFALCGNFTNKKKRYISLFVGFILTIFWCLYIRNGFNYFTFIPGLSWILVIGTLYCCHLCFKHSNIYPGNFVPKNTQLRKENFFSIIKLPNLSTSLVCLVFFFSGFAALIYQVLFSKILSYTFGSNSSAIYTVLATYMGGMAIGAWLGGKIVNIKLPPLKTYALIEVFIAIYCFLSPTIFDLVQNIYVSFGQGVQSEKINLDIFRFTLGVVVLLIPTILMGITLPVLIQHFKFRRKNYGDSIAILYSFNTIGAAMGALISGYFIIPMIGIKNTINLAVWINLLAAGIAYIYANSQNYIHDKEKLLDKSSTTQSNNSSLINTSLSFVIVMIIGFVCLGLETVYVHMLAIVAGNSVYAFSLMLFTFLIGLGLGSEFSRQLMVRNINVIYLICMLSIFLSSTIILTLFTWDQIPEYFASFEYLPFVDSFAKREFIRGLVCFLVMFPPAMIIGCLYPICLQYVSNIARGIKIKAISSAIALNTIGNILGVLIIGFVILPYFGSMNSIILLAYLSFIICVYCIIFHNFKQKIVILFLIFLNIVAYLNLPSDFNYDRLATGSNVYFEEHNYGEVIAHHESLDGGLTTVHENHLQDNRKIRTLQTNGKFQGTNLTEGEMIPQLGFGLVPLLHTKQRNDALVIGYGTGTTSKILYEAGFINMDVVDISGDIFTLANEYFNEINGRVTEEKNVKKHITDGKNFLLLSNKTYDVISMEISSIWFAGAASLYNREFYELINKNLNKNGVLQQWVQLHHVTRNDLHHIIGTLRSEFKYIWLYLVGGQGILIATNSDEAFPNEENNNLMKQIPYLENHTNENINPFVSLNQTLILTPKSVDKMFNEFKSMYGIFPISDNDNNILEYSTPKGNVLHAGESHRQNIGWLKSFIEDIK